MQSNRFNTLIAALIGVLACLTTAAGLIYSHTVAAIDGPYISQIALSAWDPVSNAKSARFFEGSVTGYRNRIEPVRLDEISPNLQQAVLAIEDHRFYSHLGIDWRRTAMAAWQAVKRYSGPRGTSSVSQQLARNLFLGDERSLKRKAREAILAVEIERRLTKRQILELYLNAVPMGHRAAYDLTGMGAASREFFGKPVRDITLPEAALLAGMIQQPTNLNPRRRPAAAKERRDLVLAVMRRLGWITEADYRAAANTPLHIATEHDTSDHAVTSLYFVDAARRELERQLGRAKAAKTHIDVTTTLDTRLQALAESTVKRAETGLKRRLGNKPVPEIALVALDPKTGAVRALVGGRDYERNQLNRAFSRRQPGSTFKPFVYAAALERAIKVGDLQFTTYSVIDDEPTTIMWDGHPYEPGNYQGIIRGPMPARQALAVSSNVATVRVAGMAGYNRVAEIARRAGLVSTGATPSAALGSYETSPLELAGSYTAFANRGQALRPYFIERVQDRRTGATLFEHKQEASPTVDPRTAYIVTNMLEDVVNYGTGSPARSLGFRLPAAGKTGTDDDGWFAGFTTELLCVVWVGYDDNRDLGLDGGRSALPIWTDFMRRASELPPYRSAHAFEKAAGAERFIGWPPPPQEYEAEFETAGLTQP